jgi:hypothetical protein
MSSPNRYVRCHNLWGCILEHNRNREGLPVVTLRGWIPECWNRYLYWYAIKVCFSYILSEKTWLQISQHGKSINLVYLLLYPCSKYLKLETKSSGVSIWNMYLNIRWKTHIPCTHKLQLFKCKGRAHMYLNFLAIIYNS